MSYKKLWGAQGVKVLCLSSMLLIGVSVTAQAQVYNINSSAGANANVEIRLQQMETQIRELTGQVEEQDYHINQLKQKLLNVQNAQIQAQTQALKAGASQIAPLTHEAAREPSVIINKENNLGFRPPTISGIKTATPIVSSNEVVGNATAQYEQAYANLKAKNYDAANAGFKKFLTNHKTHALAANAKYWLGETFYVRGEYKVAAKMFAEGFQAYPDSVKSPDMLLKLGMSLAGMEKTRDACVALSQLPVKFPKADAQLLARGVSEMDRLSCES
jgi:tol-pal system protein YbgF